MEKEGDAARRSLHGEVHGSSRQKDPKRGSALPGPVVSRNDGAGCLERNRGKVLGFA